ncbi:sulfurtransferase TusA family protein [Halostella sp. JP-L12]|uniref:sulfurtransferase TusA family protein n=1 Tax=Halostella TaxID=1843185 RepID=UPI000EF7855A|nr:MULTISPECIES: sulfurtransferase TusA family protein [Halostella]NHN49109.1 sulfurtransferase TusA family protein [Halostella sp. JP-L12]
MEIDVSGTVCPQTVLIVRRCLAELDPGEELRVVGDYPPAERSIRRSCHKHGFDVSSAPVRDPETDFALRIRVPSAANPENAAPETS